MSESRKESTIDNRRSTIDNRPVGLVKPANDHAARALRALDEKRLRDAEAYIAAVTGSKAGPTYGKGTDPESKEDPCAPSPTGGGRYNAQGKEDLCSTGIDRAWKLLLSGLVALDRADLATAEPLLLQASCLAFIEATGTEGRLDPDSLRVTALALHHVGWIYRRQDRPDAAYRTHLSAYHLRERHGSLEELWETAVELGLDADVARRFDDARRWHRAAVEAGERATEEPQGKQAIAFTNLATSCVESGRYEEAVTAARSGRACWRQHDVGDVSAARADLKLGNALLRQGEALHGRGDPLAQPVLDEALEWLSTAHEALLAYGSTAAGDAQSCLDLKDFGERLRASLELGPPA